MDSFAAAIAAIDSFCCGMGTADGTARVRRAGLGMRGRGGVGEVVREKE